MLMRVPLFYYPWSGKSKHRAGRGAGMQGADNTAGDIDNGGPLAVSSHNMKGDRRRAFS